MRKEHSHGAGLPRPKFVISTLALTPFLTLSPAHAQMFQNITLGDPKALALGNAVTADPPGIDAIHFNPAGLARLKGRHKNYKLLTGHMLTESSTGPQSHSPAVRDAYEEINPGQSFPVDDQANRSAETGDAMAMLPFVGLKKTPVIAAPFGGISIELEDLGITLATMAYTPAAMGFMRDRDNDPGAYQGYEVGLTRLTYLSPSIGFKINDEWSVGAGFGASWHGFGTKTKFRSPDQTLIFVDGAAEQLQQNGFDLSLFGAFENVGDLSLEMEDAFSPSFNLGFLYEPTRWLAFGLVYQSEAIADMEGDYRMEYSESFVHTMEEMQPLAPAIVLLGGAPLQAKPVQEGKVKMESILPTHIALGTSIKILPDLKLNIDVKWTEDSKWDVLTIQYDQDMDFLSMASVFNFVSKGYGVQDNADPDELRLPRYYQDVISWAFGVEYQWDDTLILRAGYEPRGSAVPKNRVDFLVPMAEAYLYSAGFALQIDKLSTLNIALGYLTSDFEADITPVYDDEGNLIEVRGESLNANDTTPGQVVYNPYAFLPIEGSTRVYLLALSYDVRY